MVIHGRTISASSNGGRFSLSTPLSPATAPSPTPSPVGRQYSGNDTSRHTSEEKTKPYPSTLASTSGSSNNAVSSSNSNNNSHSTHSSASRRLRSRHAFRRNLQKQRAQKQQLQQEQHQQQAEPKQTKQGLHESMPMEQSSRKDIVVEEDEERETGGNFSPPPASRPLIPAMDHHHSNRYRGEITHMTVDNESSKVEETNANGGAFQNPSPTPSPLAAAGQEATKPLPMDHVQTIHAVFGRNTSNQDHKPSGPVLDLYRDVLEVSPLVSDREMRIAYFKRGREILGEKGLVAAAAAGGNPTKAAEGAAGAAVNMLDEETQIKFQAISMAYEILSTPGWKEEFEKLQQQQQQVRQQQQHGTVPLKAYQQREIPSKSKPHLLQAPRVLPQRKKQAEVLDMSPRSDIVVQRPKSFKPVSFDMSPAPVPAKTTAVKKDSPMPSLKRSSFQSEDGSMQSWATARGFDERQSNRSVRWKDYVEELVFDNHPNEHGISDDEDSIVDYGDEEEDNDDKDNGGDRSQSMRSNVTLPSIDGNSETSMGRDSSSDLNSNGSQWKCKKKQRQKIVIESDELESHLRRMDTEAEGQFGPGIWDSFEESSKAERHFAVDFWDNFEESLDGILSMVDSLGDPVPSRRQGGRGRSSPSLASSMASTANNSRNNKMHAVGGAGSKDVSAQNGGQSDGHSFLSATTAGTIQSQSTSVIERIQSNDVVESESRMRVRARACVAAPSSTYEGVRRSNSFPSGHERNESATAGSNSMGPQQAAEPTKVTPVKSSARTTDGVKDPLSPYSLLTNLLPFQYSQEDEAHVVSPESIRATPSDETTTHVPTPSPAAALDFDQSQGERPPSPSQSSSIDSKRIDFRSTTDPCVASQDDGESTEAVTVVSNGDFTMDSVNLSELDNPFRESVSSYESQHDGDDVAVPTTEGRQLKVISGGGGGSLVRNVQSAEESEDIFAGLDDFQTYDMATIPLRNSGIAVKLPHSNSFGNASGCSDCLSDLSESVFATSKADKKNAKTKKSKELKKASSTDGSDFFSAMDLLPSLQSDASVTTMESAVESTFFDYFLAYVAALLTECEVQGFRGVSFQKDFMGLFSDSEINATESRDPEPDGAKYTLKPIESN